MGQHPKMMMQSRYAHACDLGEIVHANRFRIVVPDPGDRSRDAIALISCCRYGSKARPLRSGEYPVNDFALDQTT